MTGGAIHDAKEAPNVIADKGYDSEEIHEQIRQKSSILTIPRKVIKNFTLK